MTAINITEKQLDILVNGTIEDSFSQRANSADYDIDIVAKQSFDWTLEQDVTVNYTSGGTTETYPIDRDFLWYSFDYNYIDANAANCRIQFRDSGGNVLFETTLTSDSSGSSDEGTVYLPNATQLYIDLNDNYDVDVRVEGATNHTRITDRVGDEYSIPTGLTVNGVTQS